MAIPHALPCQAIDVQPLGAHHAEHPTTALFKSGDLEVIRLVLAAGKSVPAHKAPGDITIHCLEGALDVVADGQACLLRPGQLLYVPRQAVHALTAREDASALVTMALAR